MFRLFRPTILAVPTGTVNEINAVPTVPTVPTDSVERWGVRMGITVCRGDSDGGSRGVLYLCFSRNTRNETNKCQIAAGLRVKVCSDRQSEHGRNTRIGRNTARTKNAAP
jgi:hypothetical protein